MGKWLLSSAVRASALWVLDFPANASRGRLCISTENGANYTQVGPNVSIKWGHAGRSIETSCTIDEAANKPGAQVFPCNSLVAVPVGEKVRYRIPLVSNSRRFRAGHKVRLLLTTDGQHKDIDVPLGFRHASIGTSSFNAVFSSSRLLLPILKHA